MEATKSPDGDSDLQRRLDRRWERHMLEQRLLKMAQSTSIHFRETTDIRADIVQGPDRVDALYERHEGLVRSELIAQTILSLRDNADSPDAKAALDDVRAIIQNFGAFLMHYPKAKIEERLTSPNWVVSEVSGRQINPGPDFGTIRSAADCQCHIPTDRAGAPLVVDLPGEQDVSIAANVIREISEGKQHAGLVADLCSEQSMSHLRLAGAARAAAFEEILSRNAVRKQPIRYMTAEIFSVKGLRLQDGSTILLEDFSEQPIGNETSLYMHQHSRRPGFAASIGWILRDRTVQVTLEGQDHQLLLDWYVMVHDLAKIVRKTV